MKKTINKTVAICLCAVLLCVSMISATIYFVQAADPTYYVCFENENYAIRNANKMALTEDGDYLLSKKQLNNQVGFYVTDGAGMSYQNKNGKDLKVEDSDTLYYDIHFNPNQKYDTEGEYAKTDCYVSYVLYNPGTVKITVAGEEKEMTYNSYRTAYDEYYISSIYLNEGDKVVYGDEEHTASASGYYRILYTKGTTVNGNQFLYDEDGNYGSGDDYKYNVALLDAPRYFVVFTSKAPIGITADMQINGEDAYILDRYEGNLTVAEYRSNKFFINEQDKKVGYAIYEEEANGDYRMLDDDDDDSTAIEKITFADMGWFALSFIPTTENRYTITTVNKNQKLDDYYIVGNFNNFGFDSEGSFDIDNKYMLKKIEDGDDYYEEDYEQYRVNLTVTQQDLKKENIEFYITNGETKYRNLTENVELSESGEYIILFSTEHLYGNGRNYRYFFKEEDSEEEEILIGTAQEFVDFAKNSNASADYSKNKKVYLTADIDFSGADFVAVQNFGGKFYGGYHKLANITLTDETTFKTSIFEEVLDGGVVERLYITDFSVNNQDGDYIGVVGKNYGTVRSVTVNATLHGNSYVGGVVGYNGRVADAGATNTGYRSALIENCKASGKVSGYLYIGGISGFNYGTVKSSENTATVFGKAKTSNRVNLCIGGVAGYSATRIEQSKNSGTVSSTVGNAMYVGGIAGIAAGDMYFCFNYGKVVATRYAGGIVGYYGVISENQDDLSSFFNNSTFQDYLDQFNSDEVPDIEQAQGTSQLIIYAYNEGEIKSKSYAGGIVGYSQVALPISNSVSIGSITVSAGNYAGGIIGYGSLATIKGSLTSGEIVAKGSAGGNYVGGIAGYGYSIKTSVSVASLTGEDYIGGLAGHQINAVQSNYTNVVIKSADNAKNVGALIGFSESYNIASDDFNDLVKYNYYVPIDNNIGGIAKTDYADNYDYAATKIESEKLASRYTLSSYLNGEFDSDSFDASDEYKSYPIPYYLLNAIDISSDDNESISNAYDDDDAFVVAYNKYADIFKGVANKYTRISYIINFMEWNEDKGDLKDDDNKIKTGSFESIATVRVFEGEELTLPQFKYATKKYNDTAVYETDSGRYFVTFPKVTNTSENQVIYAIYRKITTTLSAENDTVFVEGTFDEDTILTVQKTTSGVKLTFTLNGSEITVGDVKVKYYVGDDADKYEVQLFNNGETQKLSATTVGKYVSFDYEDGQYFIVTKSSSEMAVWLIVTLSVLGGAFGACGIIGVIKCLTKNKKKDKKNKNAGNSQNEESTQDTAKEEEQALVQDTTTQDITQNTQEV